MPGPPLLLAASEILTPDPALIGGKAAGLYHLTRAGLPVPEWMVLTTCAYDLATHSLRTSFDDARTRTAQDPTRAAPSAPVARRTDAVDDAVDDANDDAHRQLWNDLLTRVTTPDAVNIALAKAWEHLAPGPLAVRSSATIEDRRGGSFAGQFDTVLDVRSLVQLTQAVLTVWRSLYGARARAAQRRTGLTRGLSMAVVIQRQAAATISGVAHTVDVTRARLDQIAVALTRGAGEALVSGEANAPMYYFPRTLLTSPSVRLLAGIGLGSAVSNPRAMDAAVASLAGFADPRTGIDARGLATVLVRLGEIEALMGTPQDVELSFEGESLWLLQSRPIAAVPAEMAVDPSDPTLAIWDNSNIAESYAGPVSPLTFSFLRQSYHDVYKEAGEVLGLAPDDVRANEDSYQHLLGYFRGRVYYNLRSWYELTVQLPGGERNARSMELMMGVRERLPWGRTRVPGRLRRIAYALRLFALYVRAPLHVQRFKTFFESLHKDIRARLAQPLSLVELSRLYRALIARTHGQWTAPILVDVFTMVFHGALNTLAARHGLDDEGSIVSALLAGQIRSHASAPLVALGDIAAKIGADPKARAALDSSDPGDALQMLLSTQVSVEVRDSLERYLAEHGDRFAGELKLEEPPLRDNSDWILALLRGAVNALDASPAAVGTVADDCPPVRGVRPDLAAHRSRSDAQRREAAMTRVRARLSGVRATSFFWCLRATGRFLGYRETLRYDRSRMFGLIRDIIRRLGWGLVAAGALRSVEDVFFLSIDEVLGFIDGLALDVDLTALAQVRKVQWERDRSTPPPPDRFWTLGAAHAWFPIVPTAAQSAQDAAEGAGSTATAPPAVSSAKPSGLCGTPCSPGVVTAIVQVVEDPRRPGPLAGKILVARSNDPGWAPLYAGIAGLLLERGSALSHAANIAREMGIPAIVAIPGVTHVLRTGMCVTMDGARGSVTIQESAPSAAGDHAARGPANPFVLERH